MPRRRFQLRPLLTKALFVLVGLGVCLFLLYLLSPQSIPRRRVSLAHTIVLRLASDPRSFNPILAQETSTTSVTSLMFVGLVRIDPFTQQPVPELADSWQVYEGGKRWVFTLKEDLRWSDGVPLTAYDVEFTFNCLIYNPAIPNSAKDVLQVAGEPFEVRALNDRQVEFRLKDVFAPFLRAMTQEILPRHALEEFVRGGTFNSSWSLGTDPREIVVNGPFRLKRFVPGQRVELERNPFYYRKGLPRLERIIMLIIHSDDTALMKFIEGELDLVDLRAGDYRLLRRLDLPGVKMYDLGPSLGSNFLAFNMNPNSPLERYKLGWFRQRKFRQAIAHCLDRKGIIETIYQGLARPQWGPMNPSNGFFYNPDLCKYDFDLAKAKQLLGELGFADRDGDGTLEDEQGHDLEISLITNANSSERMEVGSMLVADLERVGIRCHFLGIDFNNLVVRLTSSYDWETVLIGLTGGMEPHFSRNVWHSSGSLHLWWPNQKVPFFPWEKEIDEIFERGVRILGDSQRKPLYDRWQRIISCEVPVIYTVAPLRLSAMRDRFVGVKPSPYGGLLHNIDEIDTK